MTTALLRMAGAAAFITLSVFGIVAQTPEEVTFKDQIRQFVMKGDDTEANRVVAPTGLPTIR